MTYDILEKELNTENPLHPLYFFYGEEKFLLENCIKKIKKKFGELLKGINYILIDEDSVSQLIDNIESPAFGYEKKLIIVKNSGLFKKDGRKKSSSPLQEKIANYIENHSLDDIILIFIEDTLEKNVLTDVISQKGIVVEFKELDSFSLIRKLKQIATLYKVNIDETTIKFLIEVSGTNLQHLINEMRKLIEFTGPNGTISKEFVSLLAVKQIDSYIFDLTDNLGNKQTAKAMEILDGLIYQKEPLPKILVTLYQHFKKLYLCSLAISNNLDIATSIGLKPNQTFLVNKYRRQSSFFNKNDLREILEEFTLLDYNFKMGKIDLEIGLKSLLCKYC